MHWYKCYGDYGPIGGMTLTRFIRARDGNKAIDLFAEWVMKNHPVEWRRMGKGNISAYLKD